MTDESFIHFYGDSFVRGVGDPRGVGWVGRVIETTRQAGYAINAVNRGVRGDTSDNVAARFSFAAILRDRGDGDSRVVFSFGSNDALRGAPGVPNAIANARRFIAECAAHRVPVLFVGPPPVADGGPGCDDRVHGIATGIEAVCAEAAVPFIPVTDRLLAGGTWLAEARAGDGAHPGLGGYDELADLILAGGWLGWISGAAE